MGGKSGSNQPSGNTTSTTTASPWANAVPYLNTALGSADWLKQNFTPQYFPGNTNVPENATQQQGLSDISQWANAYQNFNTGNSFENGLLGGDFLNANPAMPGLTGYGNTNIGNTGIGYGTNAAIAGGSYNNAANPMLGWLQGYGQTNPATYNPAYGNLATISDRGAGGVGSTENMLSPLASTNVGAGGPAASTLGSFASGAMSGNPTTGALAQSVLSSVVPSIQKQFIEGGGLSSPDAAYATAQGAAAALAPIEYQQWQQEQANQLNAAGTLGSQTLQGAQQQAQAAGALGGLQLGNTGLQAQTGANLGNLINAGQGLSQSALSSALSGLTGLGNLQSGAASTLGAQNIAGGSLAEQALNNLGGLYSTAAQQQVQGLGLFPQTEQSAFLPGQELYQSGSQAQQQAQQQLNADVTRSNWYQSLPYEQLNQYIGEIAPLSGAGGTTTASQPFYTNPTANALSTGIGGLVGLNAIGGQQGLFPGLISGLFK